MTGEFSDDQVFDDEAAELLRSKQQIAHDRGRICKKRGCVVCQPLRAARQAKKKQRKADAQAAAHARNQPCGRASCALDRCVTALAETRSPAQRSSVGQSLTDVEHAQRLRNEKHRIGLPCGDEGCAIQACVDGFAAERARRHRKGRPCRSSTCETGICVAARSTR